MATYARMNGAEVIEMHTTAETLQDARQFLADLWGGTADSYIETSPSNDDYPRIGFFFDPVADVFIPPAAPEAP